jgi:xylulokinase
MTYLGIDLGTSALKAVLVDEAQAILAEAAVPLKTASPRPGWSEQDPRDWWTALEGALATLCATEPMAFRNVRALGLSGQMHGAVLLDRAGEPIRPAILWNDGRATSECEALQSAVPDLPQLAGITAMPGFTAPKLLWLKRHEAESFRRVSKVVSPKDFLRHRLTGEAATEMSDAAGTLWLDEAARDWSDPILAACGLGRAEMPRLVEGSEQSGAILADVARSLGLKPPVIVAGGAGDAAAAGIGIGAVEEGDAFVSLGTSAQFFVTDDCYRPQPGTLLHAFAHALPGRWFRMAAMLNGASCLDFAVRLVGESDIAALLRRTAAAYSGPSRLFFLPYLSGERTPHNDPFARGAFCGLDHDTGPTDLVQAALEGVAFSLLEARHLLDRADVGLASIAVVGGGARSRFWMQLLSHVLGLPVVRYSGSETGPAFGAARLARMALTSEPAGDLCTKPPVLDVLEPDPALTAAYAERFETYKALYQALKPEFRGWQEPL